MFSTPLVPTAAILQDRGLVIQILQHSPEFLRQPDIPPEFFTDRELFKAALLGILRSSSDDSETTAEFFSEGEKYEAIVQRILQSSSDDDASSSGADVLGLFSETLRNDFDLALFALETLRHLRRRSPDEPTFVGWELCHTNANFAVRAANQLAIPSTPPTRQPLPTFDADDKYYNRSRSDRGLHYLFKITRDKEKRLSCTPRRCIFPRRLLDLSDHLRQDPAVLSAFCHLDAANFVLAPTNWQRDAGVMRAACENCPAIILWQVPSSRARRDLESSLPLVLRILKEFEPYHVPMEYFQVIPPAIRENREVALVAATELHPKLVHPRWMKCPDFWCDAIRRTQVDLHKCYDQIPKRLRHAPPILDAVVRHLVLCDLQYCRQPGAAV